MPEPRTLTEALQIDDAQARYESEDGLRDTIEFTRWADGSVTVEVREPYAGDHGSLEHAKITIPADVTSAIGRWLTRS